MTSTSGHTGTQVVRQIKVWDWPVRLFHWLLVSLLAAAWITAEAGIEYMHWHMRCGYAVIALLLFRLLWGVWGSGSARFGRFLRGPGAVLGYARAWFSRRPRHFLGHNPLGGWMVVVLLALLAVQAVSGLFANDDIFNEGPLMAWVSKDTSDWLTFIHKRNFDVLLVAVGLHVVAVMLYLVRGDNLLKPMLTGRKPPGDYADQPPVLAPLWRAALLMAVSAGAVWLLGEVAP